VISTKLALFMFRPPVRPRADLPAAQREQLSQRPQAGSCRGGALALRVGQESSWLWRTFRVPAAVLNRVLSVNSALVAWGSSTRRATRG
jgi:hypothetical protein